MREGRRGGRTDAGRVADALALRCRALQEQAEALEAPGWERDDDRAWAVVRAHADLIEARAALLEATRGLVEEARRAAYRPEFRWAYSGADLASACQLGVLEAVRHYDGPSRGAFSNVARLYMRLALREWGINLTRRIGTPRSAARARRRGGALAEAADATAIVGRLEFDPAPAREQDPSEGLVRDEQRAWVRRWLNRIDPAHAAMVRDRFGLAGLPPARLSEVADRHGVSRDLAGRVIAATVAAMREAAGGELPPI